MVTLPMSKFYSLSEENQQKVRDVIQEEYGNLSAEMQPKLRHFLAQYLQLSRVKRNRIYALVETLYRTDYRFPRSYADYNDSTDYGVSQINKMPHLFSERFVAYETGYVLGLKGDLRFKVDCSSRITAEQLQNEMNSAFLAKAIKLKSSSKVIGLNFSSCRKVSRTQVELLQEMLFTCKAELLVDICGDDAIKLKNPWDATMIMKREAATGRTILQGDKTVVQNFSKRVNSFF